MKKNAIWAEQLTPEQLEQFNHNMSSHAFGEMTLEKYLIQESFDLHNMLANGFDWALTEQGFDYWFAISHGNEVPEPITKPIEEIAEINFDKEIDDLHADMTKTGSDFMKRTYRDEVAIEAMKKLVYSNTPMLPAERISIGVRAYEIADAMLEARKPKPTKKHGLSSLDESVKEITETLGHNVKAIAYKVLDDVWCITYKNGFEPDFIDSKNLADFLKHA